MIKKNNFAYWVQIIASLDGIFAPLARTQIEFWNSSPA